MFPFVLPRSARNINVQPSVVPSVDWRNSLTNGLLVSAFNAPADIVGPPRNYVNGVVGTERAILRGANSTVLPGGGGWATPAGAFIPTRLPAPASFNGSTSWAQFPLDLNPYLVVSIAFWYKRTTAVDSVTIEYGPNFNPNGFIIDPQSGSTMLYATQATTQRNCALNAQMPLNEWHHHVITPDRTLGNGINYWYIDGAPAAVTFSGNSITTGVNFVANGNLNIGARNGGTSAFGALEIAGLQVWNRLLSLGEAVAVYRTGWSMFRLPRTTFTFPLTATGVPSRWFLMQ